MNNEEILVEFAKLRKELEDIKTLLAKKLPPDTVHVVSDLGGYEKTFDWGDVVK